MKKYLMYLPLFLIMIVAIVRVYFSCLENSYLYNACLEPREGIFSDIEKFPGKYIHSFRKYSINAVRAVFPSPHSELLLGMVIGVDELGKFSKFKEALKTTGTIHVVVVSGFNVSLVSNLVMRALGSRYKLRNTLIATFSTLIYSVMTGFEPPVIRAWVMGNVVSWVKFYGRNVDGFRALIFTALVMIIVWPYFIFSVSFQLSFLATLGLVAFGNDVVGFLSKVFKSKSFFIEDLGTTFSAQIFVLPLSSYYFGRISIVSFLVNPLVLWTVPLATVLGTLYIPLYSLSDVLSKILSLFIYPLLDIFTEVVMFFSRFNVTGLSFNISITALVIYYLAIFIVYFLVSKNRERYEK
jgi:competence protein ComEC